MWLGSTSPSTQTAQVAHAYTDSDAYSQAKVIMREFLKAPSTAKFPTIDQAQIEKLTDNGYKVSSYVDAENSFGATLRSEWIVIFQFTSDGKIKIYTVGLDGKILYEKPVK
jgi:hypothetical protein